MKRKFLAKAITLGLMLAVPFGVEAAESLSTDSIAYGDKNISSENTSIEGNKHNYTVNGKLNINNSSSYVKNVKTLAVINIDNKGTIEADNIEVKPIIHSSIANYGIITAKKFIMPQDSSYLTNLGTMTITDNGNGELNGRAIINSGKLTADNISIIANLSNNNENSELKINDTLEIGGNLKNRKGSLETLNLVIHQNEYADGMDKADDRKESFSQANLTVNGKLTLADNADFRFEKGQDGNNVTTSIKELETTNNNKLKIEEGVTGISVGTLSGNNTVIEVKSNTKDQIKIDTNYSNITVEKNGLNSDNIGSDINGTMKKVLDVVNVTGENKGSVTAVAKAGVVGGDITATKNGNDVIVHEAVNTDNEAISNMASISLMTWRQENNDMNKRLGELRDSKGEHGAWARMARGESKYGAQNVKNQYNYYQVGYDEKLSSNSDWTVGVALTRTEGTSTFTNGSAENKHTGVAVYDSYLKDDGSFIDLIAKYARMKNEFTINGGAGNGDYETNGYSISAEYGKRFTKDNGFWIEPQVELTYGYVGAAGFLSSNGANVRQDGMDSLVGRIGFSLGRDIKAGNVYARASYLYDFDGETDISFSKGDKANSFKQDLGGSWWEVGVGTNINLSDATHLYFDVEKTYGGNVATPWQWNAGVRWSF